MLSKEKLLHPATAIALLALFVALSGVTYAAARIGTSQIANGAVTRAKLANHSVSNAKLGRAAVNSDNLVAGVAVSGNGSVQNMDTRVGDGASATVFTIPQVGTLTAACAGGVATVSMGITGGNVTATVDGINAGAGSDTPFVSAAAPAPDTITLSAPPAGVGGVQSTTWKAWSTNAGPVGNGATIWLATIASGTSCVVTGQMMETAGLPPGGI